MGPVNPEVMATPDADIPMIFGSPEEREMREGIHERIQAEIHHGDRERAFQAEVRLDEPLGWNDVEDLIMEDGEILEENTRPEKRRRDEVGENRGRKTTSVRRNKNIILVHPRGRGIQRDSIPRI